jgi:hypothetical protein
MALKEITEEEIVLVNLISFISTLSVCSVVNLIDITSRKPRRFFMINFSFEKLNQFISIMFLFLLSYQNQVSASKVDASKYGFNATDATTALKTAMAQKADTVFVSNMGTDWIVTPTIYCVSNQTIIFEKGVIVSAVKGQPLGGGEPLFRMENLTNVSLIGYGATLRMQKAERMLNNNPETSPQWGHGITISGYSSGIKILGLTIKETVGDGVDCIYGANNILIKDVICDNNYRQGMSIEDNSNVTIENCVLINTSGHWPMAGIDFEPWDPAHKLTNLKMINCYLGGNAREDIIIAVGGMNNSTSPISIDFKHCAIFEGKVCSFVIWGIGDNNGVSGTVSFEDCLFGDEGFGFNCQKSANSLPTKFTNCQWQNFSNAAIELTSSVNAPISRAGNLQFINCTINEPKNQAVITRVGSIAAADITGNIKVNSPYGAQSNIGTANNVAVQFTVGSKSNPPKIALVKPDKGSPVKVTGYTAGEAISVSAQAFDPDIGFTAGAGIKQVDFALWRSNNGVGTAVASYSDMSAPYVWPITTSTKCPRGVYLIRITAYSNDGSNTVAVVPIYIYNTIDGAGPYIAGSGIEFGNETYNIMPEKDFLIRNTSQGFMVYSPFATDSRIVISDLSGRQVTLAQTVNGKSWNNIRTQNKLSNSIYFVQATDGKGNNRIVKKAMIAK